MCIRDRLYAKVRLQEAIGAAAWLARMLVALAQRHEKAPMVGRTHMQPAMPSSVGLWASAWAESLLDDIQLLQTAYDLNNRSPLGSAASYGVPVPIDRQLTSDLLGFARPVHNVLHANQTRGKLEAIILSALGQVMLTLSRLAQDLIIFSMPEFGYFRIPAEFTTGSSIMPQKRNPDVLELLRAKAAKVLSHAHFVAEIVRASPSGYNRDLQEAKEPFLDGFELTIRSLRILAPLMAGLEVDEAALRAAFTPDVFATDRALELVAAGRPFRDAYHEVKAHLDPVSYTHLYDATGKEYRYSIWNARVGCPLERRQAVHIRAPLDVAAMREAAGMLVGTHDFAAFAANPHREMDGTVRTLWRLEVGKRGARVTIRAVGDGFLYKMVRSLAGHLLRVGSGAVPAAETRELLASRRRTARVETAAAHGLCLHRVFYGAIPGLPKREQPC